MYESTSDDFLPSEFVLEKDDLAAYSHFYSSNQ